ncbi:MAG: hypothetical protein AAGJ35_11590, partial [Myxococcota bacterium]
GGEVLAGARVEMDKRTRKHVSIEIGGRVLQSGRWYWMGTSDYLLKTGWLSKVLQIDEYTQDTGILLRSAMRWHLVRHGLPQVRMDGRARWVFPGKELQRGKEGSH